MPIRPLPSRLMRCIGNVSRKDYWPRKGTKRGGQDMIRSSWSELKLSLHRKVWMKTLRNRQVLAIAAVLSTFVSAAHAANVLKIARSYPDGGGYALKGTGVPEAVEFDGEQILSKAVPTTYCSGFTFT